MAQVIRNTANIANKVSGVKHKQTFSFNFVLLRHLDNKVLQIQMFSVISNPDFKILC